jgi:transcription elongation factor GreB
MENHVTNTEPGTYDEKQNLITPAGYEKLIAELRHLAERERPRLVDEVHQAALQGDRSENAEYIYGKKRLREIDKRLGFLKRRLDAAKVIDPARQSGERVLFGARIELEDEDGAVKTWQIVGEDESDPGSKKISWKSPVGRAVMRRVAGDSVTIHTPNGPRDMVILSVTYG